MSFEDFVLVLFLEFREPYFIRQKYAFFKKGNFPPTDLAKNLCVEPRIPPGSKSKSWPMGNFWPKNLVKGRDVGHYYRYDEGSQQVQLQSQYHHQSNWIYKGRSSAICKNIHSSLCKNTGNQSF